jgi:GH15 family glucan-1,4-alpha-glucosidase
LQITIPEGSTYVRDWAGWENSTNPGYLPFEGSPAGTLGKVNILWYQSLRASAFLARELEKNMTLAHEYDELADKVHESVNNVLYDKEKHYYYISTDRKTGVAQDLNAMAILYGVAPIADRQAILNTMDAALIDESKPGKYLAYSYDAYGYPHKAVPYSAVSLVRMIRSRM